MNFKGDWKFMVQMFNLSNTPSKEKARPHQKRSMPHIHMRWRFRKSCCLKLAECFLNYGLTAAPKKQSFWKHVLEQVCWKCPATKGTDGLDYCYVNVSPLAPWRALVDVDIPWQITPEFSRLEGFHYLMISLDPLHIFYLGLGRDTCTIWKISVSFLFGVRSWIMI